MRRSFLFFILVLSILQSNLVMAKTVEVKQNNPLLDIKKESDGTYELTYNNTDNLKPIVVKSPNLNLVMINNSFIPNGNWIVDSDITFIPLRVVFEALGTNIVWNESDKSISVENGWRGKINISKPNITIVRNNSVDYTVESEPKIINGTTYISYDTLRYFFPSTTTYIDTNNDIEFDGKNIEIITMVGENYIKENNPNQITDGFDMFLKKFPNKQSSLKTARFSSDLNQYYLYKIDDKDYYAFFINKWIDELFVIKKTDKSLQIIKE